MTTTTRSSKPPTPPSTTSSSRSPTSVTICMLDSRSNHSTDTIDSLISLDDLAPTRPPTSVTTTTTTTTAPQHHHHRKSSRASQSQKAFYMKNSRRGSLHTTSSKSNESMRSIGEASLSSLDFDSFTLFNTSMCSISRGANDSNWESNEMSSVFSESTSSLLLNE